MANVKQIVAIREATKDEPNFVATTASNDTRWYLMKILWGNERNERFRRWLYGWDEAVCSWGVCIAVIRVLTFRAVLVNLKLPT